MTSKLIPTLSISTVVQVRITAVLCLTLIVGFGCFVAKNTSYFETWTFESKRQEKVQAGLLRAVPTEVKDSSASVSTLFANISLSKTIYLVDFVYTRCPTVCRSLGSEFEQIQQKILAGDGKNIQLLSISFDDAFDTPEELRKQEGIFKVNQAIWKYYVPRSPAETKELMKSLEVIVVPDGAGGFVHNGSIHIISASGQLLAIYDLDRWEQAFEHAKMISKGS